MGASEQTGQLDKTVANFTNDKGADERFNLKPILMF